MSLLLTLLKDKTGFVNVSKFFKEHLNKAKIPHKREAVQELKAELHHLVENGLIEIQDNAHLQLNTILAQQPISTNGLAVPTQYADLDDVQVFAKYTGPKEEEIPAAPVEVKKVPEPKVEAEAPVIGQVDKPKAVEAEKAPAATLN